MDLGMIPIFRLSSLNMPNLIGIWILLQGICVAAGWTLSLLGEVNVMGYVVFLGATAGAFAIWGKRRRAGAGLRMDRPVWSRYARRFRRVFPLLFLLAALGSLAGGALHAPNNYDALSYRLPRVLMWWNHGGWHWIDTPDLRLNFSGANFEWLMMPILVLTHSDRLLFLINLSGFLLMPGLLFSVLVGAGVSGRVAWAWMWLLPMGFSYIMQAGSIGNDTIAAVYVLAAVYFAFRARKTGRMEDLGLAFVATGLATGVKASNMPLLLPLFFAVRPALGLLRSRLVFGTVMILLSGVVSFCPMALMNQVHSGHWSGDPLNLDRARIHEPMVGIIGNGLQMTAEALSPPILPCAQKISGWVRSRFPRELEGLLERDFPRFQWQLGELPQEEAGGLGLGITLLLAAVLLLRRSGAAAVPRRRRPGMVIGVMAWIALLVYMAQLGSESTSRLVASYYPLLLIPLLLMSRQARLARLRWWRILGLLSGVGALAGLALTPSRPLLPAGRICGWLASQYPRNAEVARMQRVYSVYANRNSLFTPLTRHIPDTVPAFGLMDSPDEPDSSFWQPYGRRTVRLLWKTDPRKPPESEWMAINLNAFESETGESLERWLQQTGGAIVASNSIAAKASHYPELWYVVHFGAPAADRK
jgi:hypothetical protein